MKIHNNNEKERIKVLLVGDFSGVHLYLKLGLESLGHDVTLLDFGTRWGRLNGVKNILLRKLFAKYLVAIRLMEGGAICFRRRRYDVVQFINPFVYSGKPVGKIITFSILKKGRRKFLAACGCDSFFYDAVKGGCLPDNSLCSNCIQIDKSGNPCVFSSCDYRSFNRSLVDAVDGIIPLTGTYKVGYNIFPKTADVIDFPVLIPELDCQSRRNASEKVRIFHAVSSGRAGFKGSSIILQAMNRMVSRYRNTVEIVALERPIPFDQYSEFLSTIDIVIDQTYGWALGMNSLIAMACGAVVLTRFESDYVYDDNPAINIYDNVDSIVEQCSLLVENRDELRKRSHLGIQYVKEHHHYIKQAGKFVDRWLRVSQ